MRIGVMTMTVLIRHLKCFPERRVGVRLKFNLPATLVHYVCGGA
jgi:hypothetical protein